MWAFNYSYLLLTLITGMNNLRAVMKQNPIKNVVAILRGYSATGRSCNVSFNAVRRWEREGCLPRTEITNESNYAKQLGEAVAHALLDHTRAVYRDKSRKRKQSARD